MKLIEVQISSGRAWFPFDRITSVIIHRAGGIYKDTPESGEVFVAGQAHTYSVTPDVARELIEALKEEG